MTWGTKLSEYENDECEVIRWWKGMTSRSTKLFEPWPCSLLAMLPTCIIAETKSNQSHIDSIDLQSSRQLRCLLVDFPNLMAFWIEEYCRSDITNVPTGITVQDGIRATVSNVGLQYERNAWVVPFGKAARPN